MNHTTPTKMWRLHIFVLASVAMVTAQMKGESSQTDSLDQPLTPSFMNKIISLMPPRSFQNPTPTSTKPTLELDPIELAGFYRYGAERQAVTTEDGYILEVHRIYKGATVDKGKPKPVVVVHHAFLLNSREFLTLGPGKALGFVLADAGYDVWLCNARGNSFSRKHTTLSPNSKEFWDFSYTEHGTFDIPAVINQALKVTGRRKVHYIGHSIGTISFLIMGSKRPDMLSKVQSYTALAPLTTATNGQSIILKTIMKNYRIIAAAFEKVGAYELLAHKKWLKMAGDTICKSSWYTKAICTGFLFALCGDNPQFDETILQEMLTHSPSGSSIKTFRHFGQNYFNGFREYDYGTEGNLAKYNTAEPPLFDYSKIDVPSQLYFGCNDLMANHKDAIVICKTLPHVYRCEAVPDEKFSHLDFIWAKNVADVVYSRVLTGLEHFESK